MQPIDPARFRAVPTLTGPETSRLAGFDHEFAKRVWLTLGLPDVPDDDQDDAQGPQQQVDRCHRSLLRSPEPFAFIT